MLQWRIGTRKERKSCAPASGMPSERRASPMRIDRTRKAATMVMAWHVSLKSFIGFGGRGCLAAAIRTDEKEQEAHHQNDEGGLSQERPGELLDVEAAESGQVAHGERQRQGDKEQGTIQHRTVGKWILRLLYTFR